jgi:predicted AAA+ superfamily ATPase
MIPRERLHRRVKAALRRAPAVLLVGPRQCGKTTLAHMIHDATGRSEYFDLERPADLAALDEPESTLSPLRGLVVLDEVQRRPDLFPVLRVLADRRPVRTRFLILGSASPDLLRQSSETLAGRVEIIEMGGFDLAEAGEGKLRQLWIKGRFPRSFLSRSYEASLAWRESFITTFLERDIAQLGLRLPAATLQRFWSMVAHYHGQTWNASEIGRSLGVSDVSTRRYLDVLAGAFMVRQLQPWHENLKKRQVKTPKVYVRDSGILHALLGLESYREVIGHPKCGASWEGFALEEVLCSLAPREAYFWAVHGQAELDLLVLSMGRRLGFEFKFADAPRVTRSMRTALADLGLHRLFVVYPGSRRYELADNVTAVPLLDVGAGRSIR